MDFFNFKSGSSKMVIILLSRIWGAVLSFILVPVYIKLLGVESYGLIAFYATLAGALAILDLGLSAAIIRQVSIYKTQTDKERELKNLIFSVEILNWAIAITVGLAIVILAPLIAENWVTTKQVDSQIVQQCVLLMGIVFAVQFPTSIYDGAMVGLQKQNTNAILNILFTTLKAAGVLLLLYFIKCSIQIYFIWQVIITLIYSFALRYSVYKKLNTPKVKAAFSVSELKIIWRFAAGIAGISLVTFFVSQIDKIIVSRNLEQLSYYSLAFLLASCIIAIISPLQSIIYPKFTQLVATDNHAGLIQLYHKSCKWISIIVFPIGFVLIAFAKEILLGWTKNETISMHTAPILQIVVCGTILNSLMVVPYFITLANGNTKYGLYQNIIAAIVIVPLLLWLYNKYGALGASFVWLILNAGILLISFPIFNYLFLKNQLWYWVKHDFFNPMITASILIYGAKYLQWGIFKNTSLYLSGILLVFCCILYVFIIPETKAYIVKLISLFKKNKFQ